MICEYFFFHTVMCSDLMYVCIIFIEGAYTRDIQVIPKYYKEEISISFFLILFTKAQPHAVDSFFVTWLFFVIWGSNVSII